MKRDRADYQNALPGPAAPIPPDEPIFLLRGQNVCAPATVRFWAREAQKRGANESIIKAALQIADLMEAWSTQKTAGYVPKDLVAIPTSSSFCNSKPSGRMRQP